jgi:hypothetical protein
MKHTFFQSGIVFFLLVLMAYAAPVYCLDRINPITGAVKPEDSGDTISLFRFLPFYQNQASRLHANMQRMLNRTGLKELLLNQMMITAEFPNHRHSSWLSASPMRFEQTENAGTMHHTSVLPARPNKLANMYESLRSPILAPYKYKTTNNALLSVILPIAATEQLTIFPIISYAFAVNGSEKNDMKDRGIISPIDNEGAIIYGGINLSYSF